MSIIRKLPTGIPDFEDLHINNYAREVKTQYPYHLVMNGNDPFHDDKRDFFDAVYEVVRLIPHGRVTSYGAIARATGSAQSSRLVGTAMSLCRLLPDIIPAHRVVNSSGLLTGKHHFGTANEMQKLLESEGIIVVNDRVKDFKKVFWNPIKEL